MNRRELIASTAAVGLVAASPADVHRHRRWVEAGIVKRTVPELQFAATVEGFGEAECTGTEPLKFAWSKRPFVRGADEVSFENLWVFRVGGDALVSCLKEKFGGANKELFEGVVVGDEDRETVSGASPRSPRLLPEA